MERAELLTSYHRLLGGSGSLSGVVETQVHEGIQRWVAGLDAFDAGIDDFDGRQLAALHPRGKFGGGRIGQIGSECHAPLFPR